MDEVGGAIAGALIVAGLVVFAFRRWWRTPPRDTRPADSIFLIQYGAMKDGKIVIIYPSVAAAVNDPLWSNPRGHYTVGRRIHPRTGEPLSGWSRTYENDIEAIRRAEA